MKFSSFIKESHHRGDTWWIILRAYQEKFDYSYVYEIEAHGTRKSLDKYIEEVKQLITEDTDIYYILTSEDYDMPDRTEYYTRKRGGGWYVVDVEDIKFKGEWCITDQQGEHQVVFVGPNAKEISKMFDNVLYKKLPRDIKSYKRPVYY